jgi:hypothetical protein
MHKIEQSVRMYVMIDMLHMMENVIHVVNEHGLRLTQTGVNWMLHVQLIIDGIIRSGNVYMNDHVN